MNIPTVQQLHEAFGQNVTLNEWRRGPDGGYDGLKYEGTQKQLFDLLLKMVHQAEKRRAADVAKLKTKQQVLKRAKAAREACLAVQGLSDLPKKTPLKPQVTPGPGGPSMADDSGFARAAFTLEHVVFQSRPDYFVTGNLYLPTIGKRPFPAVLHTCGHLLDAKIDYHRTAGNIASKGFVVLNIDPLGQGERDEYVDVATGARTIDRACRSHAVAGDPIYLTGGNLGTYRLWDCIRALDYLQSRKDVDANRLGVTGTSGGGWESLWLAAIDSRIKAVASSCYATTFGRRIEDRYRDAEPDPEQDPFGLLAAGMDMADIILACQPAAVMIGSTTKDFFPIDGARKAFSDASKLYKKLGLGDRVEMVIDEAEHEHTLKLRQAMYGWLQRWLMGRDESQCDLSDQDMPADPEQLRCTPTGIVLASLGGKTTAELNAERSRQQATERQKRIGKLSGKKLREYVSEHLRDLLRIAPPSGEMKAQLGRSKKVDHLLLTPVKIQSADGLWITGHLWQRPFNQPLPGIVWMQEKTGDHDPLANYACRQLAEVGNVVLDLDVRGLSPANETWLDFVPLKEANLTYDGFLLGRPVLGMRVADALCAVDWLARQESVQADRVGVVGRGYGALLALLSAGMDERIGMLVEMEGLISFSSLTWNRCYNWPVSFILPGVLPWMDLDTIRASLAPRLQVVVTPQDHLRRAMTREQIEVEFEGVRQAYTKAKAASNLLLLHDKSDLARLPEQLAAR